MSDLGQRLRDLYDAAAPPVDIDAIIAERATAASNRMRIQVIGVVSAAAIAVVLLLVLSVVAPGVAPAPVIHEPPTIDPDPVPSLGPSPLEGLDADPRGGPLIGSDPRAAPTGTPPPATGPPGPSSPLAAPLSGQIVFEEFRTIRVVDLVTGDSRDVAEAAIAPEVSHDGNWISYASEDDDSLWIVRADGSDRRQVTELPSRPFPAPFSPDGSRLAFVVQRLACGPDTAWVPPNGCGPTTKAGLWTVGTDGSNLRRLATGSASSPAWSPDGTRIAFVRGGSLWTVGADGGPDQRIHSPPAGESVRQPQFSPDGTRLAFYQAATGASDGSSCGRMELWTVNADGSQAQQLAEEEFAPGYAGTTWVREPQWSPDGTTILFADETDIWLVDATTGATRSVLETQGRTCDNSLAPAGPTWSPDGDHILTFARIPGSSAAGLIAIRPDASHHQTIGIGPVHSVRWRA